MFNLFRNKNQWKAIKRMPIFHIIILAVIQGITEFLPISSSGHLLLFHGIWGDNSAPNAEIINLILDISVHAGTLFAVLLYFRADIATMTSGLWHIITGRLQTEGARLSLNLIISSIPVIIAGFILHAIDPLWLRETWIVATTTIVFGILLWVVDIKNPANKTIKDTSFKDAILIGLAQILALIPGTSRSGITITASRALGYSRTEAARYSLLLSTIAISGAGTLGSMDLMDHSSPELSVHILIALAVSFATALGAIALMMKWLQTQNFKIFAIYRIILGIGLFTALGFGWI